MEGRIENGHLRHAGQLRFRGRQGFQARGVVQRRQVRKGGDLRADFWRNSHGGHKGAAMDHPMSDGRQGGMFGQSRGLSVYQIVQDAPHRCGMSFPGNFLRVLLAVRARVLVVGHRPGPVG